MTRKSLVILTGALFAGGFALGCGGDKDGGNKGKVVKKNDNTKKPSNSTNKSKTKSNKGSGYEELDSVPNAGKIGGTVTYSGDKTSPPLKVSKDPEICSHGGKPDGSIAVKDGKLKNVIVYLEDVKKGKKWDDGNPTIDNIECLFIPRVSIVKKRGEVVAKNSDPLLHNTNLFLKEGNKTLANIALPTKGQTKAQLIKKTGLIEAKCDVHEWMIAYVWSTPHPYAAITDENGAFELGDVPAGDYKLKMWHEVFGETEVAIKVEAGGAATANHEYK